VAEVGEESELAAFAKVGGMQLLMIEVLMMPSPSVLYGLAMCMEIVERCD